MSFFVMLVSLFTSIILLAFWIDVSSGSSCKIIFWRVFWPHIIYSFQHFHPPWVFLCLSSRVSSARSGISFLPWAITFSSCLGVILAAHLPVQNRECLILFQEDVPKSTNFPSSIIFQCSLPVKSFSSLLPYCAKYQLFPIYHLEWTPFFSWPVRKWGVWFQILNLPLAFWGPACY